jgi:hypothetical protein
MLTKEELIICIPTHMRESVDEQRTLRYIPEEIMHLVYFFTCETRVDLLKEVVPEKCTIIPVPEHLGVKGISGKRQFIVEWAKENNFKKIWQIDDRVEIERSFISYEGKPNLRIGKLQEKNQIIDFLKEMSIHLDTYPIVGHLNRSGTFMERRNNPEETLMENRVNRRIYTSIAVRPDILIENDLRFDFLQQKFNDNSLCLMEDYSLLLQAITKGFNTLQVGNWCFDKSSFSGKGGCTNERTIERQKNVCLKLQQAFPDFVNVVEAKDKVKASTVKFNVRISWKKLNELKNPKPKTENPMGDWC